MSPTLAVLLLALAPAQPPLVPLPTPADAVALALADARTLPADRCACVRYLWLGNLPPADREDLARTLNGHFHGLSDQPRIVPYQPVAGGLLLRVNLRWFGWKAEVWEKFSDPLFHVQPARKVERVRVVKIWPGGKWADGKEYARGSFTYYAWEDRVIPGKRASSKLLRETAAQAQALAELEHLLQTGAPILQGWWFLNDTAVQEQRQVGYYGMLGIKNQGDFERLIRFDPKLSKDLFHRRVVAFSGIALEPRRLEFDFTVLGLLQRTFDNGRATARANPLRQLLDDFQFEATEQFAPNACGFPVWYLGNNRRERQDKAPDNVVGGYRHGPGNDTRLHINYACWGCHAGQDKAERCVKTFIVQRPRRQDTTDGDLELELARLYQRDVRPRVEQERVNYTRATVEATGWEPYEYANRLTKWWEHYEFARVDLAWASRDLGVPADRLKAALERAEAVPLVGLDPVLSLLIEGKMPIRQYEEVLSLLWETWRKYGR